MLALLALVDWLMTVASHAFQHTTFHSAGPHTPSTHPPSSIRMLGLFRSRCTTGAARLCR